MPRADADASEVRSRPARVSVWLIVLAGLIPIIPIGIGVALLTANATRARAGSLILPFGAAPTVQLPRLSPAPPRRVEPKRPPGTQVALLTQATILRAAPGGAPIAAQPTTTPFGSSVAYYVREVRDGWLGVVSPLAGNNRLGWIPSTDAIVEFVDWKLEISLARRQLTVLHGRMVVERYSISIGRPTAPTPTGVFAVTDRLSTGDPSGPYGCCILALSALAPHAIQDWFGGNRIAIHSTPPDTYWSIGDAVTHGCMHVTIPEGQWLIDHIPLGTPAIIRSD